MTNHSATEKLGYSRTLLHAAILGLRSAQIPPQRRPALDSAVRSAITSSVVSAGIVVLGAKLRKQRNGVARAALACASLTFCAEFLWKTRALRRTLLASARKEISRARDQHWLELNPVDYA